MLRSAPGNSHSTFPLASQPHSEAVHHVCSLARVTVAQRSYAVRDSTTAQPGRPLPHVCLRVSCCSAGTAARPTTPCCSQAPM